MKIQLLYFAGCPNHQPTVARVRQVVERLGVQAAVEQVEVMPGDDAAALRFLGSPTVLVNGRDIDPVCREGVSYGFGCRVFAGQGVPDESLIERAIRDAADGDPSGPSCCCESTGAATRETSEATPHRTAFYSSLGAVGTAILATACCWTPLLLLTFGASAAGVAGFFETVRPFFLAAAAVFLGAGFYFAYAKRPACQPGDVCAASTPKLQRLNRAMLWAAAVFVIIFGWFPYYGSPLIRVLAGSSGVTTASPIDPTTLTTRTYRIQGMTCPLCAAGLETRVAKLPGVAEAHVSYDDAAAVLHVDPDRFAHESFKQAVESTGFHALPPPPEDSPDVPSDASHTPEKEPTP